MLAIYYFCSHWLFLLSARCDSADAEQNIFLLLAHLKMFKGFGMRLCCEAVVGNAVQSRETGE